MPRRANPPSYPQCVWPVATSAALLFVALSIAACTSLSRSGSSDGTASATIASVPPAAPVAPYLGSPEASVRSYLDWTTYAYRIMNSDVATRTMSAEEEVRVNSYLEKNRQDGVYLDQALESFNAGRVVSTGETRALVPAREVWSYRYVSISKGTASPFYSATYDATYAVIAKAPGTWIVDSVQVKAMGEVR